ncbi:MAG: ABC transporter permease [Alphaproteobacteria bacterium]
MTRMFANTFRLGLKELQSLRADPVMLVLIAYAFIAAVYLVAKGANFEVNNASIAFVDEDRSLLSRQIISAIHAPYFQTPVLIPAGDTDSAMYAGRFTFVVDIPPRFEADVLSGNSPVIQVNIDATAMTQAGNGARYVASIMTREILDFTSAGAGRQYDVNTVVRVLFNPNLNASWFTAVMQIINSITILGIVLTGAALIREREHGTIEHLLAMPVAPIEIMFAKIWATGIVILTAAALSLVFVVQGLLDVRILGSVPLFLGGAALYLFSVTSLGIFLGTLARTMPQFGLLAIPVFIIMILLSGSTTPLDSMPEALQTVMSFSPSTHFISFSQSVLYRGAGLDIVWPSLLIVVILGALFFFGALFRFRRMLAAIG